jgi:hypothetical protein
MREKNEEDKREKNLIAKREEKKTNPWSVKDLNT